jgi:hypothetical protein
VGSRHSVFRSLIIETMTTVQPLHPLTSSMYSVQQLDIEGPEGDANLGPNAVNVALLQALQEQSKVLRGVQDVLKEMQADQGGSGTSNDKIAEQMNNVGLISAFMCSIIFSVFIACDSDELNAADLRWDALEPTKWVIGGNAQLSEHLAYTSALGVGFNTLGMLLAVTVLLLEGSSHDTRGHKHI